MTSSEGVAHPPLVEREAELDQLDAVVLDALRERGGAVRITGPPGVGKTALLTAVRARAADRGMQVLHTSGRPLAHSVSYGTVRALFSPVVDGLDQHGRAALFAGAANAARHVLGPADTSGVTLHPTARPGSDAAFAIRQALYWFAVNLSRRSPLLMAVDDQQWIDAPSAAFLSHVAARLDGLPLAVIVADHDDTTAAAPQPALAPLPGPTPLPATTPQPAVHMTIRVPPLTEAGTAAMLTGQLGKPTSLTVVDAAMRVCHGNPFRVTQLAAALRLAGGTSSAAALPDLARDVLSGLSDRARRLAEAVVILAGSSPATMAADLAEIPHDATTRLVEELAERGIARPVGSDVVIDHPLIAAAIDSSLTDSRREALHGLAARLRVRAGHDRELVAAHVLSTSPRRDPCAGNQLRRAGQAALERGSADRAVVLLQESLRRSDTDGSRHLAHDGGTTDTAPGAEDAALLAELGAAQSLSGQMDEAIETLRRARCLAVDPTQRAQITRPLAALLILRPNDADAGVRLLHDALTDLPDDDRKLGQALEGQIATAAFVSLAARHAARQHSPGRFFHPRVPAIQAAAAMHAAFTGTAAETSAAALAALDDGALLADETAESPTFWLATLALIFAQRFDHAERVLAAAARSATDSGSRVAAGMVSCFSARLTFLTGRLPDAEFHARRFLELTPDTLTVGPAFLIDVLLEQGKVAEASRLAESCPDPDLDGAMAHFLLRSRAAARLARGDIDGAITDLEVLADGVEQWGTATPGPLPWRTLHAEAWRRRGDRDRAATIMEDELSRCRAFGAATCTGIALRHAAAAEDDRRRQRTLLEESCDLLADGPARLEYAYTLVELGDDPRAAGEVAPARDLLQQGLTGARGCGATALASRAFDALTATGARPRKLLHSGVEALTPRERHICTLVADGMSNREIAEALFVTVRTIETHLDRSFKKLGLHRRHEVAAALRNPAPRTPQL